MTEKRFQRTKLQQTKIAAQILFLKDQGLNAEQILKTLAEGGTTISQRTYYRYAKVADLILLEEIKADTRAFVGGMLNQKRAMFKDARLKYQESKDPRFLSVANEVHNDFFRHLQELGLIEKNPDKVQVSGELSQTQEIIFKLQGFLKPKGEKRGWVGKSEKTAAEQQE
jgi:hypothetical protein